MNKLLILIIISLLITTSLNSQNSNTIEARFLQLKTSKIQKLKYQNKSSISNSKILNGFPVNFVPIQPTNPFNMDKLKTKNTDISKVLSHVDQSMDNELNYNPQQMRENKVWSWMELISLPDFFLKAQDTDTDLLRQLKDQLYTQYQSQDLFQDIHFQLIKFEDTVNKTIEEYYSKGMASYNLRNRFQELKEFCTAREALYANMWECLNAFNQNLTHKFQTQVHNAIIAQILCLLTFQQQNRQLKSFLLGTDETLNLQSTRNLTQQKIKNNFESRRLTVTLNRMKVTLNSIKHINFNLFHDKDMEEDLNHRVEDCEAYFNDALLVNQAKTMGINYYTTLDIESILDSILNIWNPDWRVYDYTRYHLDRLERVVDRATSIRDKELQCAIAHLEVFFKHQYYFKKRGDSKKIDWSKIQDIANGYDKEITAKEKQTYINSFYNWLITGLQLMSQQGDFLIKVSMLFVDMLTYQWMNHHAKDEDPTAMIQVPQLLMGVKNSLVRILTLKQFYQSLNNVLNLRMEGMEQVKSMTSKNSRKVFFNIYLLLEFLLMASRLITNQMLSWWINVICMWASIYMVTIYSLVVPNIVSLMEVLVMMVSSLLASFQPSESIVGMLKVQFKMIDLVQDQNPRKISILKQVQGQNGSVKEEGGQFQDAEETQTDPKGLYGWFGTVYSTAFYSVSSVYKLSNYNMIQKTYVDRIIKTFITLLISFSFIAFVIAAVIRILTMEQIQPENAKGTNQSDKTTDKSD